MVVLLDPRGHCDPGLGPGDDVLELAELKLQRGVAALDDRIVKCRAGPAHRLLDPYPTTGGPEVLGGVLASLVAVKRIPAKSDRGCQYTSTQFAGLTRDCDVTLSVGRTGQCWDNALAESFFASLKGECLDQQSWPTRARARRAIVEYIAWYNRTRLHSALAYLTPQRVEHANSEKDLRQVV